MIVLENIHKTYGKEKVIEGLSLEISSEETLAILGKSGSGKSTLLKILAGWEKADEGSFKVNNQEIFNIPAQKRGVVYLSQEPLLFPHVNVFQNLAYGLKIRKETKATIKNRVEEIATQLGLSEHLYKMPTQLSGGQKQRVNFGRTLIIRPKILLLDEPFGSLDADTRLEMQKLFKTIRQQYAITSFFVTHDLKEALLVGTQIARMQQGNLQLYASMKEFLQASDSGVVEELNFWEQITTLYNDKRKENI